MSWFILGAIFLLFGFGVRLISIPLMITMIVAAVTVHLKHYLTWLPWGYIGAGCVIVYQATLNAKDKVTNARLLDIIHRLVLIIPLA